MIAVIAAARRRGDAARMRALLVALALAFGAGCSDDAGGPGPDLAVSVRDMATADLAPSGCPPAFTRDLLPCRGNAVCRYPTDAGPYDHLICLDGHWQWGDCPFGPGYATGFAGCIGPCEENYGEAITTCQCLPNGNGVCCIDTGGLPTCGNFDGGT